VIVTLPKIELKLINVSNDLQFITEEVNYTRQIDRHISADDCLRALAEMSVRWYA
jgi:hypothetical protein